MTAMSETFTPTTRTQIRRKPTRGRYDRALINQILDEALICHVAFIADGHPYALPTIHARIGETLYLHGANGARMLKLAAAGEQLCVTATLIDGIVLARSAMHHSLNYRSAVVIGSARQVTDPEEKRAALDAVVEHIIPGRSGDARKPSDTGLAATIVLAIRLEEASAKVRSGGPVDDPDDRSLPVWAGELPLAVRGSTPVPAADLDTGIGLPAYVAGWPARR
jgi:nitroimidazol reductase NimA-like FMN-containing flavoprotein (pyridoxamine 5'-phosphate oxidase superfamily)